jgi:hypothetical protein
MHPQVLLPPNADELARFCEPGGVRKYAVGGIKLLVLDAGYRLDATNGRLAGTVTSPHVEDLSKFPTTLAMDAAPSGKSEAIIQENHFRHAFKSLPKKSSLGGPPGILKNVAAVIGETTTTLVTTDRENVHASYLRNLEGRFPDIDSIVPTKEPIVTVQVNPKGILKSLSDINSLLEKDEGRSVFVDFRDATTPIVIRASSSRISGADILKPPDDPRLQCTPSVTVELGLDLFKTMIEVASKFTAKYSQDISIDVSEGNVPLTFRCHCGQQMFRGLLMPFYRENKRCK